MILTDGFWDSVGCLWLLGTWCWHILAVKNCLILLLPHLYLLSLSYLWIDLFYSILILNMSMHTTDTPGVGGGGGDVK